MRKNYISAAHLQSEVKEIILSANKYELGTAVHPSAYFFNYQDHIELQFLAFHAVKSLELKVLKEIISYPKTIKSLLSFIKEMKLYKIQITDLPNQSEVEQEIMKSIKALYPLVEEPLLLKENDFVISTGLDHSSYSYSKKNHLDWSQEEKPSTTYYHYAQNKRQEFEAVVQNIIEKKLKSVCIVVADKKESLALIESILKRYGLEGDIENRSIMLAKQQFHSYFNFLQNPNQRNFLKSLERNVFQLKHPEDSLKYIKHYNIIFSKNIPYNLCTQKDDRFELVKIQKRVKEDMLSLSSIYDQTQSLSYQEKFEHVYTILFSIYGAQMRPYKIYFENYFDFIKEENHSLILEHILSFNSKTILPKGWKIVDYNNLPLLKQENVYLTGLSASNFPNIGSNNGLIDEKYLEKIDAYPSLQERSNYELKLKRRIYTMGDKMTFSYHIANYEGKGIESSFEIKDFFHKKGMESASIWPLHQIRYREKHKPKLNPDLAKKLFTKNHTLQGSVSSLQLYAQNPLQYFMEQGLGLRENKDISFNPMIFGTLNHEIIEKSLNGDGNMEDSWQNIIWPNFPESSLLLQLIKDRNDKMMQLNINYLKEADKNTNLVITETEKRIVTEDIFNNVSLTGYVDRIDISENHFSIVDYKSSPETISQAKLEKGIQLQLLSYASIIKAKDSKERLPMAVFNFAFRSPNKISQENYSYKQSTGITKHESMSAEDLWKTEKRYKGWFFENPTDTFYSGDYWTGLSNSIDGGTNLPKSVYDFELVEALLQDRYHALYEAITNGILDIDDLNMDMDEVQKLRKDLR